MRFVEKVVGDFFSQLLQKMSEVGWMNKASSVELIVTNIDIRLRKIVSFKKQRLIF